MVLGLKSMQCMQVKKGEGWVTQSGWFGFGDYVVYASLFPDGTIYDVTELSVCQGMLNSAAFRQLGSDCCKVWLHFGDPEASKQRQRHQAPNETGGRKNETAGGKKNKGRNRGKKRR